MTIRALLLAVARLSCAAVAGAADPRGELRVAIPWTPENLDPTMNLSSIRATVGASLFDSLVGRDRDNRIVPELAESWRLLNDTTPAARRKVYADLARTMVDDATWVFLVQQVDIYAARERLGWTPRADQWMSFTSATLK